MKNIMRPTRRSILRAGAASVAVLAMPAYLRAQSQSVKVGILQPVTGALAQDGEFGRIGAEMAIKEINDLFVTNLAEAIATKEATGLERAKAFDAVLKEDKHLSAMSATFIKTLAAWLL